MILGELLRRQARWETFGNKTALIFEERRWTYTELNAFVNRIANALRTEGVAKGERVAVLGRNSDVYVALYFALAKLGAILVPVNFWYREEEIRYTLDQSGSRWLIVETRDAPGKLPTAVEDARMSLSRPLRLIWYTDRETAESGAPGDSRVCRSPRETEPSATSLASLLAGASFAEPGVDVHETDPHIILYTSGTTGFPKGATFSHRAHFLHAVAWALQTGQASDDVGIVVYPLFHTGGPDCVILPHFLVGGTVVVQNGADPVKMLQAIEQHRLTNVFCVPTVWRWLLAELAKDQYDVSSVRRCLGSSDTLPVDLLSGILECFAADVWVTYGLTEAGCILTYLRLTQSDHSKIHTVGKPHPLVELRIVDAAMRDLGPNQVGEIVARGPTLMDGYWNMPEQTGEAMAGGWLHTGDLGQFDADGYVSIAGRLKDMIVSGGEKIYPLEVEKLLRQHPKIRDVALIGVPDREWGQAVLAVVVPEAGATLSAEEVIEFVRPRLAGYKKPRYVEFVDALPVTTSTGKVQKALLREHFATKYRER